MTSSQLVAKLRELGFQYDTESKRAQTFKKKGSVKRVTFNTRDQYDEAFVRGLLCQAGMSRDDAAAWAKETEATASNPKPDKSKSKNA